jgi:hypothetical protein
MVFANYLGGQGPRSLANNCPQRKVRSATTNQPGFETGQFERKKQVAELFAQVRTINDGMIRVLEVRGGLSFSMEICVGC